MDLDNILQNLEIPKEGIFYKCPYCDYKNADKKAILKHIKSKHQDKLQETKGRKKNQKSQQQKRRQNRPQRMQQRPRETVEYKDYMYLFTHKKRCLVILGDGTKIEGLVKSKDRYNIMILDTNYIPEGWEKPPKRIIIQKGHVRCIIPLEEDDNK